MIEQQVSVYKDVSDVRGKEVSLSTVLDAIKSGKWKDQITRLRSIQDETEQKAFKNTLLCFTGSGVFSSRKTEGLIAHSGIMILDFDAKDNPRIIEKRQDLIADRHTAFLFTSCRGNGLAVGVKIDGVKRAETFQYLEQYYQEKHGLITDKGCKDVCRLRFISYDPDLHLNENAEPVIVPSDFLEETKHSKPVLHANDKSHEIMRAIIASGKLIGDDSYDDWLKIGFALTSEFGEEGRKYFHELSKLSPKYDSVECDRKFDNCLETNKGEVAFATIIHLAKGAGIDTSVWTSEASSNIEQTISNTNPKTPASEIKEILSRIAQTAYSFEQSKYIDLLSKRTRIPKSALMRDVKSMTKNHNENIIDSNITVAHPSYEVNCDFMSLGFRETVIVGDHTEDRNLYLVSRGDKYELHEDTTIVRGDEGALLFDVRERMLVNLEEKWSKSRLLDFVKNPTAPVGLYQEIKQTLKRYVEFKTEAYYGLLASWIMATYFHRCFNAMPFVFFYGKKGCGKTRGLDLCERLAFNAYKTKGVSVASLADSVDATRSTFLNDQAESLSNPKNEEILGILTDSYTIGGGKRRIVVITNKSRKVVEFETYSPKAFASIKDIDSDLKDRCILFPMIRASREYPYPEAYLPIWGELRDKLYRLLLVKWKDAKEIYQTTGTGMSHRVRELWKPIETMLRLEDVPPEEQEGIKAVFLEAMQETQVELSDHENELFDTLLEMMEESDERVFSADEIAKRLHHDEGISEKAIQTWVGQIIKQMSLYTQKVGRKNGKRAYLFNYDHVKNIRNRYTSQTGGTGGQVVFHQQSQGISDDHLENTGGNDVVCGKGGNTTYTTYDHLRPPTQIIGGQAKSLTGQGKAGEIPPIPPKMAVIVNDIFAQHQQPSNVENLDTEDLKEVPEEIPEVDFIEEVEMNV